MPRRSAEKAEPDGGDEAKKEESDSDEESVGLDGGEEADVRDVRYKLEPFGCTS